MALRWQREDSGRWFAWEDLGRSFSGIRTVVTIVPLEVEGPRGGKSVMWWLEPGDLEGVAHPAIFATLKAAKVAASETRRKA